MSKARGRRTWVVPAFVSVAQVAPYDGSLRLGPATTLLPEQDKPAPFAPTSGVTWFVVSCGVRLSEVGLSEIRKPQVGGSSPLAGWCYCIHITERATFLG